VTALAKVRKEFSTSSLDAIPVTSMQTGERSRTARKARSPYRRLEAVTPQCEGTRLKAAGHSRRKASPQPPPRQPGTRATVAIEVALTRLWTLRRLCCRGPWRLGKPRSASFGQLHSGRDNAPPVGRLSPTPNMPASRPAHDFVGREARSSSAKRWSRFNGPYGAPHHDHPASAVCRDPTLINQPHPRRAGCRPLTPPPAPPPTSTS
jgi:hypothetical protein